MIVYIKHFVYNKESQILKSVSLKVSFINSLHIIQAGVDFFRDSNMYKFHDISYISYCFG